MFMFGVLHARVRCSVVQVFLSCVHVCSVFAFTFVFCAPWLCSVFGVRVRCSVVLKGVRCLVFGSHRCDLFLLVVHTISAVHRVFSILLFPGVSVLNPNKAKGLLSSKRAAHSVNT